MSRLGAGAMGEVYRAEDLRLGQEVALKFLPPGLAGDSRWMARLQQEVKLARRVSHPNVCRVHDVGESSAGLFISMEHIDGEDLASLLRRVGRLPSEKVTELARQMCAGLAAAHAAGVLHRDLKPANVMLDSKGRAHITDFGLAIGRAEGARRGEVAGTPTYMAPEQIAGGELSEQTDLYALGVLLYELLTGKRPFAASSWSELRRVQEEGPVPLPSALVSGVDPELDVVIGRCLAPDPRDRPASALAILTVLSGGDELQAALSAGQTPTPEAVANAAAPGALRPAAAWACFAATVISFAAMIVLGRRVSVVERSALELPPDVLVARARDMFRQLGYDQWGDVARWGFEYDQSALRLLTRRDAPQSQIMPILFWYRQGIPVRGRLRWNRITGEEPPIAPGELAAIFDPRGRLLSFAARPETVESAGSPSQEDSWAMLFRFAGLEPSAFERLKSAILPPVYADSVQTWQGVDRGEASGYTVKAAALNHRPVYFEVWDRADSQKRGASIGSARSSGASSVFIMCMLGAAAFLARHNLRSGRGDRRGAARTAAFVFTTELMAWIAGANHTAALGLEMSLLTQALAWALFSGSWVWLFYVALEPHVRRLWPESLVAWSRLLMGRVTDAMVARDILFGLLATCVTGLLVTILVAGFVSGGVLPLQRELEPLLGARFVLPGFLESLVDAVTLGQMMLLLLLLSRVVARRRRLGSWVFLAVALGLLSLSTSALAGTSFLAGVAPLLLAAVLWLLLLTRLGLLGMVTCTLVFMLGMYLPDALSLSAWYSSIPWSIIAFLMALAVFGLYFSVGKRRLIPVPALDT